MAATIELHQRFDVPGFSLAWDVWGDAPGPPLVLIHGYTGSAHDFAGHVAALAAHRRVFVIDHRGHGESSRSGDEATYTVDHIVDDVLLWADQVVAPAGEPFDLLGHSMGGRVALRFALARRDLVRSLLLMDTTAWRFGAPGADEVSAEEMRAMATAYFSSFRADEPFPAPPRGPEDELVEATMSAEWLARREEIKQNMDPMAAKALGVQLFGDHLTRVDHQLGDIDCPVTVLVGELDEPYVSHAPRFLEAMPDAELVVFDGAYHSPQLTHADQWRAAIEAHFDRVG